MRRRGFAIDYNIELANANNQSSEKFDAGGFKILEVHRFEGQTSSDDESVAYGIQAPNGDKGFLVNGYGISSDPRTDEFLKKMTTSY
jgi:hypothetical protein